MPLPGAKKENHAIRFQSPAGANASSPEVDRLVEEVIRRVADKWTLLLLETLGQHGVVRFSRLAKLIGGISQKMLTQTLRHMEADGFVTRTVYPVVPPRVEYALTPLGESLGLAFCAVWEWAETHYEELGMGRGTSREETKSLRADTRS